MGIEKYWITNSAVHANFCVVFAQTEVNGQHEGINAFLVRIRENDGSPSPGCVIEEMGKKVRLNESVKNHDGLLIFV